MGLFGPQWKSRNQHKAIDAINSLSGEDAQEILQSIVINDNHSNTLQDW